MDEKIKTGTQLRQIAELENPTLRTPQQQVESLLMMATLAQGQLKEALQLLNFRDRQISAALDGLEDIVAYANKHMNVEGSMFVSTLVEKAVGAIDMMRKIHKESLHESV